MQLRELAFTHCRLKQKNREIEEKEKEIAKSTCGSQRKEMIQSQNLTESRMQIRRGGEGVKQGEQDDDVSRR